MQPQPYQQQQQQQHQQPQQKTNAGLMPSLSRLMFDDGAYKADVRQSVGPGEYVLSAVAAPNCRPCLAIDPRVAVGTSGTAECRSVPLIDIESDLHNIGRKATLAPEGLYQCGSATPSFRGSGGGCGCSSCGPDVAPGGRAPSCPSAHPPCRGIPTVDTRLANPPCTLRGTGWNRWEWLCSNPQERALMPFDANIDTSIVVKDNHRPHLARPLDPTSVLPPGSRDSNPFTGSPQWEPNKSCGGVGPDGEPPLVTWQTAEDVKKLMA